MVDALRREAELAGDTTAVSRIDQGIGTDPELWRTANGTDADDSGVMADSKVLQDVKSGDMQTWVIA